LQARISCGVSEGRPPAGPFYLVHLGGAVAVFAAALLLIGYFDLDWRVSGSFFDPAQGVFPLRDDWLLERVAHVAVRNVIAALGLGVLAAAIASFRFKVLASYRRLLWFVFFAMLLSSSAVSGLKSVTGKHCPYDLEDFGGSLPHIGLLQPLPVGVAPGKCWPGGHASAGFCLFGVYFAALALNRRRLAASLLIGILAFGFALGMGRVAQGAHFVSHNLWSALICWLVTLALYQALIRRRRQVKGD
jgi:membrane-associated PAP2 superfamily phosphatase